MRAFAAKKEARSPAIVWRKGNILLARSDLVCQTGAVIISRLVRQCNFGLSEFFADMYLPV